MFVRDEVARSMHAQHVRDCEQERAEDRRDREIALNETARKFAELAHTLEVQNETSMKMHKENGARISRMESVAQKRFTAVMCFLVPLLLSGMGALAFEVIKRTQP